MKVYWLSRRNLITDEEKLLRDLHGEGVEIKHGEAERDFAKRDLAGEIRKRPDGIVYADVEGAELARAQAAGYRFRYFGYTRGGDGKVELVAFEVTPKSVILAEPDPDELPVAVPAEVKV